MNGTDLTTVFYTILAYFTDISVGQDVRGYYIYLAHQGKLASQTLQHILYDWYHVFL